MNDQRTINIPKFPFLIGDFTLVAITIMLILNMEKPLTPTVVLLSIVGFGLAALIGLVPYLLEFFALVKLNQIRTLAEGFKKLQQLDTVANTIHAATTQWLGVHDLAQQSLQAAKDVTEQITREAQAFRELIQKINDSEKNLLKLEVEKLHRAQADWVQVMIGIFDHIYALYKAAVRSGRPELIDQLTKFQSACRDLALRIGLVPVEADRGDLFDPNQHAPADPNVKPEIGTPILETIATGYIFQNRLIRPVIVKIQTPPEETQSQQLSPSEAQNAKWHLSEFTEPSIDNNKTDSNF